MYSKSWFHSWISYNSSLSSQCGQRKIGVYEIFRLIITFLWHLFESQSVYLHDKSTHHPSTMVSPGAGIAPLFELVFYVHIAVCLMETEIVSSSFAGEKIDESIWKAFGTQYMLIFRKKDKYLTYSEMNSLKVVSWFGSLFLLMLDYVYKGCLNQMGEWPQG